jgi:hypothetical protein
VGFPSSSEVVWSQFFSCFGSFVTLLCIGFVQTSLSPSPKPVVRAFFIARRAQATDPTIARRYLQHETRPSVGHREDQKAGKRAVAVGDEPVVLQETPAKHATPPSLAQTKWNTDKLGLRMGSDALAAGAAGALVAPIITIIDKGIMENASGRHPLGESLKKSARELLLKPHHFLTSKPFALIFVRSSPVHPRHSRKASASKHKLIRAVRLSTSAPTSPPTQSTPSPPRAHKPPSPQPPPAPRSSPSPRPPTSPCASTKTTNSPSSSAHPDPNGPFRSPHSPSSPCATASPSSPRSTCRPCSRPSWRRRWARR